MNTCSTCQHFDPAARKPGPSEDDSGMCRFPPPAVQPTPLSPRPWPFCKLTDWCSHWAARNS